MRTLALALVIGLALAGCGRDTPTAEPALVEQLRSECDQGQVIADRLHNATLALEGHPTTTSPHRCP